MEDGKVLTLINESIVGTKIIRSFDKGRNFLIKFKKNSLRIHLFKFKEELQDLLLCKTLFLIGCK